MLYACVHVQRIQINDDDDDSHSFVLCMANVSAKQLILVSVCIMRSFCGSIVFVCVVHCARLQYHQQKHHNLTGVDVKTRSGAVDTKFSVGSHLAVVYVLLLPDGKRHTNTSTHTHTQRSEMTLVFLFRNKTFRPQFHTRHNTFALHDFNHLSFKFFIVFSLQNFLS